MLDSETDHARDHKLSDRNRHIVHGMLNHACTGDAVGVEIYIQNAPRPLLGMVKKVNMTQLTVFWHEEGIYICCAKWYSPLRFVWKD